ncbi:hypothetical protein GN956_G25836 [Arapaima gigas]
MTQSARGQSRESSSSLRRAAPLRSNSLEFPPNGSGLSGINFNCPHCRWRSEANQAQQWFLLPSPRHQPFRVKAEESPLRCRFLLQITSEELCYLGED